MRLPRNKKSQGSIFAIIFIIVILIFLSIVIFIYLKKSGYFEKLEEEKEEKAIVFLLACQDRYNNFLDANYVLEYNNMIISEGKVKKESFNDIISKENEVYHLSCWNDNYYVTSKFVAIGSAESYPCNLGNLTINCKKIIARSVRIGNLSISHTGKFTKKMNETILRITSDSLFNNLGLCMAWTTGVTYAIPEDNLIKCSSWVNYSKFDIITNQYEYYPENITRCKDTNLTYKCEKIIDNVCIKYPNINPPSRLTGKVDICYDLKTTLDNSSLNLAFKIKTLENLNERDYIELIFIDKDRRKINGNWSYVYETQLEKDIGSKDIIYKLIPEI